MINPALLRPPLFPQRHALQPQLTPLRRGHARLARKRLLAVFRDVLQEARVAQVDVGRDAQRSVVKVRRTVRQNVLGPSERLQGVRGRELGSDGACVECCDDVSGLAAAGRALGVRIRYCGLLEKRDTLASSILSELNNL